MIDPFGRKISYLRLSVTDRCDFRCRYCMTEAPAFVPKAEILSLEELDRLCAAFVGRGVRKIRITGGEPLVRRDVLWLFEALSRHLAAGRLDELTLTTNGSRLEEHAEALAACGVRRVNVSLDSLDAGRFAAITRGGRLDRVLAGIAAAAGAGLGVRINTVALKAINEDEFDTLLAWCGRQGHDLCLIETMPIGEVEGDRTEHYLPLDLVRRRLERRWTLADSAHRSGGPARYLRIAQTGRLLGLITPMTHGFCAGCNRVRVTCTGSLAPCLGREVAVDLKAPLRSSRSDGPLLAAIDAAIAGKPRSHDFVIAAPGGAPAVSRTMNATGG